MINWLNTFIEEKGIDLEDSFEVNTKSGQTHFMSYEVVVEFIKIAPKHEQEQIKKVLVMIDFKNGDVKHFFRHLALGLAENQEAA